MPLILKDKVDVSQPEWAKRLKSLVKKCTDAGPVAKIFVFGSFARGEMTDASDLDVAVILPDGEDIKAFRARLERPLCDWPMDLVVVHQSRYDARKDFGGVLFEVKSDGIELYPTWRLK